jgi:Ulp1 family protease
MYSYFQVFFPINVTETHWSLVVVNGHKCCVQVLDSMGTATRRPEVEQLVRDYSYSKYLIKITHMVT